MPVRIVTVFCLLLTSLAEAAKPTGEKFVYKQIDGHELAIYRTQPPQWQARDSRPAIVFFHGGGWVGGAPGQFTEHAAYFASRGLVCFQAQYRLLDRKSSDAPITCIRDARSAMRWVRSRAAEFGIDPHRIAAAGGSAGGHLAATLGTIDQHDEPDENTDVSVLANAMILFNPVLDNGPDGGWGHARVRANFRQFSPAHNITKMMPPTIVFLGDSDKLIPVSTMERFQAKATKAGVRCELKIFPGEGHGFFNHGRGENKAYVDTVRATDKFLASLNWLDGQPTLDLQPPQPKPKPVAAEGSE